MTRPVPLQAQHGAFAEHLEHPLGELAVGGADLGRLVLPFFVSIGGGMVASTMNGPVTRVMFGSTSGRSTSTSSAGGSLLAMFFSVTCGTMPPTSSPCLFCLRL